MAPNLPPNLCEMIKKMAGLNHDWRAEGIAELQDFFSQTPIPSQVTTHKSMLIIWKGLHCAMLHQPEPLLQEELADKISKMINCFKKEKHVNLFVQAAMETFEREWHSVNTFMVDKMMMFFRRILRQALFRLADQNWRHSDMFMKMLEEVVIRPLDDDHEFKVDVKMHLSSLFMEELAKAHNEHFTHATLMIFLQPFIKVITVSRDARYVADVHGNIFQHLIRQSDVGVDSRADLQENEILVQKNTGKPVKPSKIGAQQESYEEVEGEADEGWEDMDSNEDEDIDEHKLGEEEEDVSELEEEEAENEEDDSDDYEDIDEEIEEEEHEKTEEEEEEGSDDEEEEEEGSDDEGEVKEGSDEEEGSDDEEDEEDYPLDPRAGNVDVVLPQIEVNYENLVKVLCDIMESEASQMRFKNLRKLRTLIRQLQDVVGNVYPLAQHPTVHPVHKLLDDDVAEVDLDRAIQKRIDLHEEEFKADPKVRKRKDNMTMEMLEQLYAKSSKIKNLMQRERAHKWIALNLKRRQYEKRKEELKFKKYAKRTLKLKTKVDNRRLKAQGLLLSTEDKQKEFKQKTEAKRHALLNVITNVTQVFSSAATTNGAPSFEACKAVSSSSSFEASKAVPTSVTSTVAIKSVSDKKTLLSKNLLKGAANKDVVENGSVKQNASSLIGTVSVASETHPKKVKKLAHLTKSSNVKEVTVETPGCGKQIQSPTVQKSSGATITSSIKKTKKIAIEISRKNKEHAAPPLVSSNAKLQEHLHKLTGTKRSRILEESPVRIAKKQKTLDASVKSNSQASPLPSNKAKKNATTPTGIKINLGQNKQHEFKDYRRSILASPAIPYQPDKTPLSSVLKATTSPILVKKPFSQTLRSIPINAKFESAPSLGQKKMKSKKSKVSPHVLKGLQKKGMSLEGLASTNKSPKLEINVKEKSRKGPKVTSGKPVARKHSHARASAADFF